MAEEPKEPDAEQLSNEDVEALLNETAEKIDTEAAEVPAPAEFSEVTPEMVEGGREASLDLIKDVSLGVRIELGRSQMYVHDVLELRPGSVIELEKLSGEPLNIMVNERLVARGQVLVLNNNFCVRITEIISEKERKELAE